MVTYESKIGDARWIAYDLPGNVGWIVFLTGLFLCFKKRPEIIGNNAISACLILDLFCAAAMVVGIIELISERIQKHHSQPLPYLSYAYRHPVQEEEKIKVENIQGKIVFVGAEDDVLWDTCKYIRRMEERLKVLPHQSSYELLLYKHGTHFVFPDGY